MKNPIEIWRGNRSPFRDLQSEMQRLQSRMENLFGDVTPLPFQALDDIAEFMPRCDIAEDKSNYFLKFDLPGVPKDQLKVELVDNLLTVSAERKEEKKKEDQKSCLSEVSYGSYMRSFTLPSAVNEKKIDAQFENGVLSVTIPKTETTQAKQIAVH